MCTRQTCGNIVSMIELYELIEQPSYKVFVRSPRRSGLARVLTGMGATVLAAPDHGLWVTGMDSCAIASAAAEHYIPIQALAPSNASLQDTWRLHEHGSPRKETGLRDR